MLYVVIARRSGGEVSDYQDENRLSRRVHGAGLDCRWQGRFFALIVADRHFLDGFDCRVFWGPSSPCLSLEGGPATIALDIHLEDGGVMNETDRKSTRLNSRH